MGGTELSKCENNVLKAIWSNDDILTMQEITLKVNALFRKTWGDTDGFHLSSVVCQKRIFVYREKNPPFYRNMGDF